MSVAAALRSANAQEFALSRPAGEDNWKSRAGFCDSLASAIEASSKDDAPTNFAGSIEPLYNNILDCAISERTTLSIQACRLLGLIPKILHTQFHPHIDRVLPVLIRQTASTKAVAQKSASAAIANVIFFSGFNVRILWHVCQTFEDKYSAPKLYAPGWLKLIIENYYPALNPDRDYESISRVICIGLEEADNNVRVNTRATFWAYHKIDPTGAGNIIDKLNAHAKTALINDPNNPDKVSKTKSKNKSDSAPALAQIRQQAKDRMKQKAAERPRIVSAQTITSEDFVVGAFKMGDDKQSSYSSKHLATTPTQEALPAMSKTTSRPIAIHKKASSQDGPVANTSKKSAESSTARPLLSAPVRRPRIVATPISNTSNSRPASRTGTTQPQQAAAGPALRTVASNKEFKSSLTELMKSADSQTAATKPSKKITRSELSSPVHVPHGKENANIYVSKRIDRTSPERIITPTDPNAGPTQPPKMIVFGPDGTTREQRLQRQQMDKELADMAPLMPLIAPLFEKQDVEKNTLMYHAYPTLNHDGQLESAQRALGQAIEYLKKDSLDLMGFRKLRKLLEEFSGNLIVDQTTYNFLFSELLSRLGTFEELLKQPLHEVKHEAHPRYIRQAVLAMVNILIRNYPVDWSIEYEGPALAAAMLARCAYTPNSEIHEGAPYIQGMTIVNQINISIEGIIASCADPVATLDSILSLLSTSEDFLMSNAPHDSEVQQSWASFNPYSKINRLRSENCGLFHRLPKNLNAFEVADPTPLPTKLPLLMETGLRIIKGLLERIKGEEHRLTPDREDILADLARHLLQTYNVIIRRQVMEFSRILYATVQSKDNFWAHFPNEDERNLLHYYVEKAR